MIPPSRLIISNFATGFEEDREPFIIDNDAFPTMTNAYIWRGRIQKKRGATKLGKLTRKVGTTDGGGNLTVTLTNKPITAQTAIFLVGTTFYQDTTGVGTPVTLTTNGPGGATLNLTTGVLTITGGPATTDVLYQPALPVMGIEDFENVNDSIDNAPTVFFDTRYAYQFNMTFPTRQFYDVSFYKVTGNPVIWSGADYQQFWSANFVNALFVTNNVPGLSGVQISSITKANPAVVTTLTPHNLTNAVTDWIYIDGVTSLYNPNFKTNNISYVNGISLQINTATTFIEPATGNSVTVTATVTGANTIQLNGLDTTGANGNGSGGFLQILTRATSGQDGIRWYDGDPTANAFATGWVNFAPPLNKIDPTATNPVQVQTYLVGALMLVPFRGTFVAIGTWEQAANAATPSQFPQRLRWSTFSGTPFYAQPVPVEETADPLAWVTNVNGRGGFLDIVTAEEILTATNQQETIVLGLERSQRRLVPTGSVISPFVVQIINPEFGSTATFSAIPLDRGTLSVGDYGFILTSSYNSQRFDIKIPDRVFQIKQLIASLPTGPLRVCSTRNWQEETIYFTFVDLSTGITYPNRTLIYNYRDPSFGFLHESYTTYGQFRDSAPYTWNSLPFKTWLEWIPNWAAYQTEPGYPLVAGGNQVGYVMLKEFEEVGNDPSLSVANIASIVSTGLVTTAVFTVPNHNLELNDYFFLQNVQGLTGINNTIWQITKVVNTNTINATNFTNLTVGGSYTGQGEVAVMDNFLVQTKQFGSFWQGAKGARIGTQRFLLDRTTYGEFQANLLISQDSNPLDTVTNNPWNISNNIVRTRPDDSLGIRGSEGNQSQIWHRNSNSALGDSVQMQFSMNDAEMRATAQNSSGVNFPSIANSDWVLHSIVIDLYPSRILT